MVVEDGCYTGEIEYYAYGPTKAEAIAELAESEGYDLSRCYAYSDSVTDVPMLEAVGHPHAVNPDRALRREAAGPRLAGALLLPPGPAQAADARLSMPPRPALAVAAAAVGAAAGHGGAGLVQPTPAPRSPAVHAAVPV